MIQQYRSGEQREGTNLILISILILTKFISINLTKNL
jgi:hypothetical protein